MLFPRTSRRGSRRFTFIAIPRKTLSGKVALIRYDEHEIGDLAARELLQLRLEHYAVVPDFAQSYWSAEREAGFLAAMQVNLKGVSVFSPTGESRREIGMRTQAISGWLSSLPLSLGVFAVNDEIARDVVSAMASVRASRRVCSLERSS